jgi:ribosomal protein S12 methylthiotransferase
MTSPAPSKSKAKAQPHAAVVQAAPKVGFVSLGCPKALVDSERILTQLRTEGYQIVPTYDSADVVVVNTCGFIDSAVEESLDAIGEAMAENGKVVVTGCLGARAEQIRAKFPDVLSISGPADYSSVMHAVHKQVPPSHDPFLDLVPPAGLKLTPKHYAYLKISEGCNHRCTFCIIPSMRGDLSSRPVDEVLNEAQKLVQTGVRELLVISQDTSAYGVDVKYAERTFNDKAYQTRMRDLASGLAGLSHPLNPVWVRMHYVYPYPHVDDIIPMMAEFSASAASGSGKHPGGLLPYLDIPFQHANPRILKLMKRPAHGEKNLERIQGWRKICPDLTLRSTFIVGFPGETEAEFQELLDFLQAAELDRVGCFKYSPVTGAKANDLPDPIDPDVQQDRYDRFMKLQQKISAKRLKKKIGLEMSVLVDAIEGDIAVARSSADAPEIDGKVLVSGFKTSLKPGQFVRVKIESAGKYDLRAVAI